MKGIDADVSSPDSDQLDPAVNDLQIVFNAAKYMFQHHEKHENLLRLEDLYDWLNPEKLKQLKRRVEEAEQEISYFDDEYIQGALGVPENEIRHSLEWLERTTRDNGGQNRRRFVLHTPERVHITCAETANGDLIGRFTTLEIIKSGYAIVYTGVNAPTLSHEYVSTVYCFEVKERDRSIRLYVQRGQHIPKQLWLDLTKLYQAERTPPPHSFIEASIQLLAEQKHW